MDNEMTKEEEISFYSGYSEPDEKPKEEEESEEEENNIN